MPRPRLILLLAACSLPALTAAEHDGPPPRPSPEALFALFDSDKSGDVSKAEFAAGLAALPKRNPPPPRDGERPPRPEGEGDGQRPPRPPGDGDGQRPPRPPGDGDGQRPPRPPGDGDGPRPPRPQGDGPRPPRPSGDGDSPRPPKPPGDEGGDHRPPPLDPAEHQKAIDAAFAAGDGDGSGALDKAEFAKALQAMPKPPRPPGGRPPGGKPKPQE
jgi:translation initiation factor IF-2